MSVTVWNPAGPVWAWAGPVSKVRELIGGFATKGGCPNEKENEASYRRLFCEALGMLVNFSPEDRGVIVEIRYAGTQRQHIVVAPCEMVTA